MRPAAWCIEEIRWILKAILASSDSYRAWLDMSFSTLGLVVPFVPRRASAGRTEKSARAV
jgi:hypothetical protein